MTGQPLPSEASAAVSRNLRADRLKERIYVCFVALAVVLALHAQGDVDGWTAFGTLTVTVLGTLLAVLTADLLSHMVVHQRRMTRDEFAHALSTSLGTIGTIAVPAVLVVLAALGALPVERALMSSAFVLVLSLVVVSYLAIRRLPLRVWQKALALTAEAALGLLVIALQLLAHG